MTEARGVSDKTRLDLSHVSDPGEHHSQLQLLVQQCHNIKDPLLAVVRQTPQYWPPNKHCTRTEGNGFQSVCASGDTAIQVDLAPPIHRSGNLRKYFYGGGGGVQLPCPMVGHPDAVHPVLHRQLGVLWPHDPFDYDLELGDLCRIIDNT